MPFLMIPIILFVAGIAIMMVFALGFALIHVLFWPVVIGLFIWWLVRQSAPTPRRRRDHPYRSDHTDWQSHLTNVRKEAHNVKEEPERPRHHVDHDDDWSDF
ncbi:hypothetical protein [Lacticaseibacillus kribbianus]|uniref:hypothetical protein n=1 Tax=Lacticaseibacillus kribbianus TaxID=2926292 RepID=UPI001CD52702|nr:hypothetical protein [Lacticaseibacillus kribbianus]